MELSQLIEKLQKSPKQLWGIVVYEIVGNGCLNAMWTNNFHSKYFMNEIARKKGKNKKEILGNYTVSFIESDNSSYTGNLNINQSNGIYNLKWEIADSEINFEGAGMLTGESQLTVMYWQL